MSPTTTDDSDSGREQEQPAAVQQGDGSKVGVPLNEISITLRSNALNFVTFGSFLQDYLFVNMSIKLEDLVGISLTLKETGRQRQRRQRQLQTTTTLVFVGLARFGNVAEGLEELAKAEQTEVLRDVHAIHEAMLDHGSFDDVEIVSINNIERDTEAPTVMPTASSTRRHLESHLGAMLSFSVLSLVLLPSK